MKIRNIRNLVRGTLAGILIISAQIHAQQDVEFVMPDRDADYESNLGSQDLVSVSEGTKWVGKKPSEIAPGAIPLGVLKQKTLDVEQVIEKPVLVERPRREPSLNPEPIPSAEGWVGALPHEIVDNPIPLGKLKNISYQYITPDRYPKLGEEVPDASPGQGTGWGFSLFSSTRLNRTNNVLRTSENIDGSGVWENALGMSLNGPSLVSGGYLTLIPKLDFMMQWANYDNKLVKDLLNYQFGLVKTGLNFQFPNDWSLSTSLEYDFLHGQTTGDKMFDAVVPSVALSKIFIFDETTFLLSDLSMRYSFTEKVINFAAEGIFPDDGDNLQTSLNLAFVKLFGENGQFRFMPTLGMMLARYSNHDHKGRVDFIPSFGLSLGWQPLDWLSADLGFTYSTLSTNSKGEAVLLTSSSFQAYDLSFMLSANKSF